MLPWQPNLKKGYDICHRMCRAVHVHHSTFWTVGAMHIICLLGKIEISKRVSKSEHSHCSSNAKTSVVLLKVSARAGACSSLLIASFCSKHF